MRSALLCVALVSAAIAGSGVLEGRQQAGQQRQTQGRGGQLQPPRDTSAAATATAAIGGRVMAADSGRPVKRARVIVSGSGRGGRSTVTDDQGRYLVTDLPAGRYTISATKAGFVNGIYGQRHPLQAGTPIDLADGQQAANVDVRLVRGGVITGHVADEDGEPLVRARVTVQRYQYVNGERQLTIAGTDDSDDRGQYRVFGLAPGDYFVSATALDSGRGGRGLQIFTAAGPGGRGGGPFGFGAAQESEPNGYAPTYYPGVVTSSEAGKIAVAPGQEIGGIDFQVQLVTFATVRGVAGGADDSPVTVMLVPQDVNGAPVAGTAVLRGRVEQGGAFTISNVAPGRYLAVARSGGRRDDPKTAIQTIAVNGQDINNLALVLTPGVSVSGNITVESSGTPAPTDYSTFRVDIPEITPLPLLAGGPAGGRGGRGMGSGRAEPNGAFEVDNLIPGIHDVRVTGQGPWTLKSVSIGGRDVTDQPFELKSGQNVGDVLVVLTDRSTSLDGTVRDGSGTGLGGLTVIAFSTDAQYWRPQSREIQTARTDQSGAYHLSGLPPGDYQIAVVDEVEQGQWFDPSFLEPLRAGAKEIKLAEGDRQTLDLPGPK